MLGLGLEETLLQYLRAVGWSVTAAVGFAFGVGIALKVFDYLSTDIDEWEEIKKGTSLHNGHSPRRVMYHIYHLQLCLMSNSIQLTDP